MKNVSIFRTATLIIVATILTQCNSQSNKIVVANYSEQNVKEKIVQGNETATAQKDTYSNYQKFVKEAYIKLDQNETAIVKLNHESNMVLTESMGINASEIEGLKISHNTLKMELDEYVQNGTGNWQSFKSEFYSGLNELEIACNTTSNKLNL